MTKPSPITFRLLPHFVLVFCALLASSCDQNERSFVLEDEQDRIAATLCGKEELVSFEALVEIVPLAATEPNAAENGDNRPVRKDLENWFHTEMIHDIGLEDPHRPEGDEAFERIYQIFERLEDPAILEDGDIPDETWEQLQEELAVELEQLFEAYDMDALGTRSAVKCDVLADGLVRGDLPTDNTMREYLDLRPQVGSHHNEPFLLFLVVALAAEFGERYGSEIEARVIRNVREDVIWVDILRAYSGLLDGVSEDLLEELFSPADHE